ncbi:MULTISPECIES: hypothetical protein [unclassified Streptomyces]|uniref:hypothetical protein n=1 Tax=unclassified Streptomyces TaxID=2593676 RepID=UPI00331CA964
MRVRGAEPRPPTSTRPAWAALLVAALVCAVLTAALGGCPRMRALAGSAVDATHRPSAATAPRAVAGPRAADASGAVGAAATRAGIAGTPKAVTRAGGVGTPRAAGRAGGAGTPKVAGPRCHGRAATTAMTPAPEPVPRVPACVADGTRPGVRASAPPPAPEPRAPRRVPGGRPEPLLRV